MLKRSIAFILSFIFILFSFSACGKDNVDTSNIFSYAVSSDPVSLDPQIAAADSANVIVNNCFEGLVRINSDGNIIGGVAKNWSLSSDSKTYTFNLRKDAKWYLPEKSETLKSILGNNYKSDFNTSVTANDFVFAFQRALTQSTSSPDASTLFVIKNAQKVYNGTLSADKLGVKAADDYTLQITLEHPSVSFLTLLTNPVCMPCNEEFFNATEGRYGLKAGLFLCNGPFYVSAWVKDDSIILRKNPDYSGENTVKPYKVTLKVNDDSSTYLTNLTEGTYSIAKITSKEASKITKEDNLTVTSADNKVWAFMFNTANSSLSNTNIRLALCYAVNPDILYSKSSENKAEGIVPSSCMISAGSSYRANVNIINTLAYSMDNARSNWNQGINYFTSHNVSYDNTITLLCTPDYEMMLRNILQNWQSLCSINVVINIEVAEQDELEARMSNGNYDIAFAPLTANEYLAVDFLNRFTTGTYGNVTNYSSTQYDKLLSSILTSSDKTTVTELCREAEENLIDNGIIYPVYSGKSYYAYNKDITGLYIYPSGENISFINAEFK